MDKQIEKLLYDSVKDPKMISLMHDIVEIEEEKVDLLIRWQAKKEIKDKIVKFCREKM